MFAEWSLFNLWIVCQPHWIRLKCETFSTEYGEYGYGKVQVALFLAALSCVVLLFLLLLLLLLLLKNHWTTIINVMLALLTWSALVVYLLILFAKWWNAMCLVKMKTKDSSTLKCNALSWWVVANNMLHQPHHILQMNEHATIPVTSRFCLQPFF